MPERSPPSVSTNHELKKGGSTSKATAASHILLWICSYHSSVDLKLSGPPTLWIVLWEDCIRERRAASVEWLRLRQPRIYPLLRQTGRHSFCITEIFNPMLLILFHCSWENFVSLDSSCRRTLPLSRSCPATHQDQRLQLLCFHSPGLSRELINSLLISHRDSSIGDCRESALHIN